jgi:hypothetical protein
MATRAGLDADEQSGAINPTEQVGHAELFMLQYINAGLVHTRIDVD